MFRPAVLGLALACACASAHATTYIVESRHTQGVVRWSHLGFSNPAAHFTQVEGTLDFDPADPARASVAVAIPLASLSSGEPDLDDDFHSAAFFDIAQFPVATFRSSKVEKGDAPGKFKVSGDFSLHGMTHAVVLDVTLNKIGINERNKIPAIGFEATATLKRSDYGLDRFVPQVSDDVQVQITFEGDEAKAFAQHLKADADEAAAQAKRAAEAAAAAAAAAREPAAGKAVRH